MISKSKYISGRQCLKKFYLEKKHPDLKPPVSAAQQAMFDQGHTVGELARQVFPDGRDATPASRKEFARSIALTQQWLEAGEQVIYEATFAAGGAFAMLDILQRGPGGLHAIEVKSSTSVKDYHFQDAALQYYAMAATGWPPARISIMHLDNKYRRTGALEPEKLFVQEDITDRVKQMQPSIPAELEAMQATLQKDEAPEVAIGPHCSQPFSCDFRHHCWKHLPRDSVFELPYAHKAWQFYREGRLHISDLEASEVTPSQRLYHREVTQGKGQFQVEPVRNWLSRLGYPLVFLDFETIFPALPPYEGFRPYEQLPVQYSVHRIEQPGSETSHRDFLADFNGDPREALALSLLEHCAGATSILAYNVSFEQGCIRHLMEAVPHLAGRLEKLLPLLDDLIVPFRKKWVYWPGMRGSNSLKRVYPSMPAEKLSSYQGLHIQDGGAASRYLEILAQGRFSGTSSELSQLQEDLKAYCRQDTAALVELWKFLNSSVCL